MAGDAGDVLGRLQPPLDLQGGNAGGDQLRQPVVGGQIVRAERIGAAGVVAKRLAVADHLVGQAAGLGALAAIGAAPAERQACQTLARVADAQRAVDEDFEFDVGLPANGGDLGDREFPRQHHPPHAQRLDLADALGAAEGHLGRGVQRQLGAEPVDQPQQAEVLHQHGIDARRHGQPHGLLGLLQFVAEDQRVERQISFDAAGAEEGHQFGQFGGGEVDGPGPGVEAALQAEIHGIGPVFHGGLGAVPIAGGGH